MSGLRTVYTGIAGLGTVQVLSPCGCQLGCIAVMPNDFEMCQVLSSESGFASGVS